MQTRNHCPQCGESVDTHDDLHDTYVCPLCGVMYVITVLAEPRIDEPAPQWGYKYAPLCVRQRYQEVQ